MQYNDRVIATGIVSVGNSDCDANKYMLYTKLSEFTDWIKTTVSDNS